jgi:hypothetical protein
MFKLSPEQVFELNEKLLKKIRVIYKTTLAMDVLKWVLMVLGASLAAVSLWLMKQQIDMQSLNLPRTPWKATGVTPLEDHLKF